MSYGVGMDWKKEKEYRQFERDIEKARTRLDGKPCRENFGDAEIRKLKDKYSDCLSGNWAVCGRFVERLHNFENWCYNYTG